MPLCVAEFLQVYQDTIVELEQQLLADPQTGLPHIQHELLDLQVALWMMKSMQATPSTMLACQVQSGGLGTDEQVPSEHRVIRGL